MNLTCVAVLQAPPRRVMYMHLRELEGADVIDTGLHRKSVLRAEVANDNENCSQKHWLFGSGH